MTTEPSAAEGPSVEAYMERLRKGFPVGAHQRWASEGNTTDAAELDWWDEAFRWAVEQLEARVVRPDPDLAQRLTAHVDYFTEHVEDAFIITDETRMLDDMRAAAAALRGF